MFSVGKKDDSVTEFWTDFEAATGETVLAKSMGKYLSGWDEYTESLWGLVIATSGGFRFHHFPKEATFFGIPKTSSGGKPPKEKTFFIPKEAMLSVELVREKCWWKKILASSYPLLFIHFRADGGIEKKVCLGIDINAAAVADALKGSLNSQAI